MKKMKDRRRWTNAYCEIMGNCLKPESYVQLHERGRKTSVFRVGS
jgi:hypothetical protein